MIALEGVTRMQKLRLLVTDKGNNVVVQYLYFGNEKQNHGPKHVKTL
jgi:hypothetical protein